MDKPTPIRIGVLHGDGIGPEVVSAAVQTVDAALASRSHPAIIWEALPIGHEAIRRHGNPLPTQTLDGLDRLDAWVLGPHDSASYPNRWRTQLPPGGAIRKRFDLFANIRPARTLPTVEARAAGIDLVVVRENTEGFYADRNMHLGSGEFMPTPDVAMAVAVVTRQACERIAHVAFRLAQSRRKRVTIAHKANVLALTTGLFRDVCHEVGAQYPDVEIEDQHIDALAALMVRRGETFDVVLAENMFGDILSDLTGELAGSIGNAPSLNTSDSKAMAQAAHGAAPDIAGTGIANPTAMILSTAMLLRWLGARDELSTLHAAADAIDTSVEATVAAGIRTPDLGGKASTAVFVAALIAQLTTARSA
ncbi:isocitrate/isopropylmalate dehydrogenase family protein [Rhodococcus sp. NPDC057529]|uniref:isocitrate/isopropylmalate dehydrogenase family protein n=1 Tax=Rhodococcus sp. NPDC057529 TaxID=3346158 RepID=UPI00367133E0